MAILGGGVHPKTLFYDAGGLEVGGCWFSKPSPKRQAVGPPRCSEFVTCSQFLADASHSVIQFRPFQRPALGGIMALYLISYDVDEKNREEYEELWSDLDGLGAVKVLYSEYAVPFSGKAIDLASKIEAHLKEGDRLLVCELFDSTPTNAWLNLKISTAKFRELLTKYARSLS